MSTDHTPTENTPERVLASALEKVQPPDPEWVASISGGGVPGANWVGWARAMFAASPTLRDALTRGLAGSEVVEAGTPEGIEAVTKALAFAFHRAAGPCKGKYAPECGEECDRFGEKVGPMLEYALRWYGVIAATRATPPTPALTAEFEYAGEVYVRPVGRGIRLVDSPGGAYIDDVVDEGHYRMEVRIFPLAAITEATR